MKIDPRKLSRANTAASAQLKIGPARNKSKALTQLLKESTLRRSSFHHPTSNEGLSNISPRRSPKKQDAVNRVASTDTYQFAKQDSEDSKNPSGKILEDFTSILNQKRKEYSPVRRYSSDAKSVKLFKEKSKEKKSTFFLAKNFLDTPEEGEKLSLHTSDSDNMSCPDPQGFKNLDCMSDVSLNDSFTSYTSEKSTGLSSHPEIFILPVVRKSRFCTQRDENKTESKGELNNSDEEKKSERDQEESEENRNSSLLMRRNKTDTPPISTNRIQRLTVPNSFLDEQTMKVFEDLSKLKIKMEKSKTAIETYKFIGTTAKTLLNQVPYVKGNYLNSFFNH